MSNRMYIQQQKLLSTIEMKMVIAQPPPHHQQKQRDQHKAKRIVNCTELAAEKFDTLGKI